MAANALTNKMELIGAVVQKELLETASLSPLDRDWETIIDFV